MYKAKVYKNKMYQELLEGSMDLRFALERAQGELDALKVENKRLADLLSKVVGGCACKCSSNITEDVNSGGSGA